MARRMDRNSYYDRYEYDRYEHDRYERDRYERDRRPVRRKRKKRKGANLLYMFAVSFLGIVIVSLVIILLFKVQKIEIKGNNYCTSKQIKDMVQNDKYSVNALYILGKYMTDRGEILPCFESVRVTLRAPWHVKVEVKEKTIVGYLTQGEENIYFDMRGLWST